MTNNPYLRRVNKRDSGFHGRKAEESLAKRLKGELQPGSGNLPGAKGDVKLIARNQDQDFLIENKATTGASISVKQDWLLKIYQEALETGKIPALAFQFTNEAGKSEKRDRWVALPEHFFKELIGG